MKTSSLIMIIKSLSFIFEANDSFILAPFHVGCGFVLRASDYFVIGVGGCHCSASLPITAEAYAVLRGFQTIAKSEPIQNMHQNKLPVARQVCKRYSRRALVSQ